VMNVNFDSWISPTEPIEIDMFARLEVKYAPNVPGAHSVNLDGF